MPTFLVSLAMRVMWPRVGAASQPKMRAISVLKVENYGKELEIRRCVGWLVPARGERAGGYLGSLQDLSAALRLRSTQSAGKVR